MIELMMTGGKVPPAPGKQVVLRTLADAHKFSIRRDMRDISDILHGEYDDFFGLEG